MRILSVGNMYPPHHLGGYELMWRSAVEHLRRAGHEVRVLTTDFRRADPDTAIPEDPDAHRELRWYWRDHEFPRLGPRERLALERHNRQVLSQHLRELAPDVVNWWAMGGMSMSLLERVRRRGLPAIGVVVDDWMLYGPRVDAWRRTVGRLGPVARLVQLLTGVPTTLDLGSAGSWVFVSETTRRRAREAGWDLPDTTVAHAGIDPSRFPRAPERPWRDSLLYLGRIDPRKGIATAVRALEQLPNATLRIVGGGDQAHLEELQALVGGAGLDGRVEFTEVSRDQVASVYAESDALLFPVLWEEPWGLVPLEAMAVGTPVVATGAGGSGEYLHDGGNCLIFSPRDDPAALADAVRRLADDAQLRRRIRQGGFDTAARFHESAFNEAVALAVERAAERG